jgi:hypothetical protein
MLYFNNFSLFSVFSKLKVEKLFSQSVYSSPVDFLIYTVHLKTSPFAESAKLFQCIILYSLCLFREYDKRVLS